jgi:hypothetical protein
LEKHFKLDIDYKNLAPQLGGAVSEEEPIVKQNGRHNSEGSRTRRHFCCQDEQMCEK